MVNNCIYFSPYSGLAYVTDHARDMMGMERTRALDFGQSTEDRDYFY